MQNLNINQADCLSQERQYDLTIVGSGISCAYTTIEYIKQLQAKFKNEPTKLFEPVKIAVLDKSGEFWTGIPYGSRTGQQSLIITSLKEFLPEQELKRFTAWLTANYDAVMQSIKQRQGLLTSQWLQSYQSAIEQGKWEELFLPRYMFGWYLQETVKQLLESACSQGYLQCDLLSAEVLNVQKSSNSYQVEYVEKTVNNSSFLKATKVVLAIGSPPNKVSFVRQLEGSAKSNEADSVCFITNMYEPAQNTNLEGIVRALKSSDRAVANRVLIIGSNASALEAIYSLNNLPEARELIDKFIVISPNGEFPHRIGDRQTETSFKPLNLLALSQLKDLTAKQILEAVKLDVAWALEQGKTVDSTYKIISKEVIAALNRLSFAEQKQFVIKYGVEIGKYQRRAGADYLNVVDKLVLEDKLQLIKGKFVRVINLPCGGSGFELLTSDRQIQQITKPIKVIINCAGFQNLNHSSSPLIRNLVQQGICTPNDSLCGFEMNENFEANQNLYLMGPLVAGNINAKLKIWHAESCGRIINLSQQLAQVLVD